ERPSGRATPSLRDAPGDAPIQIDAVPKLIVAPQRAAPAELKFGGVYLFACDPCFADIAAVCVEFQVFYVSGRCRSLQ
ncbi:hypothetical protein CN221_33795, partial [Sinorhizobium meliloti]|uniref:hypothetical protein n=1 Tax=Rhizobium meliloti TaxID=382 RepID=UPI000FE11F60